MSVKASYITLDT